MWERSWKVFFSSCMINLNFGENGNSNQHRIYLLRDNVLIFRKVRCDCNLILRSFNYLFIILVWIWVHVGEVENVRICFFKEPCYFIFLILLNSNEGGKKFCRWTCVFFYFILLMDVCVNYASRVFFYLIFYYLNFKFWKKKLNVEII